MRKILKPLLQHPLNQANKMAAVKRFLRWQLATRLLNVPYVMPIVDDTVLVMEKGMTGATGNWYNGLHEAADMAFLLHALRAEDVFIDVGANVGSYTVLAAGAVGATTVSFEPIAATFARLQRNITANGAEGRATAHNIGLGAQDDVLRFTADDDAKNHVITDTYDGAVVEVPVRRVDDMLEGKVPFIAKIDVEG